LSNERLSFYLNAFSEIKSIKDIRFHSRYPVIMPSRFDQGLLEMLKNFENKFRTISLAIHVNHAEELNEENRECIRNLSKTNLQLLSQSVLLKGVNDNFKALKELFELFIELKIKAYYLHHPDMVKG